MFGILFGVIGLVLSLAFGLVSGTTKVAVGTTKVALGTTKVAVGTTAVATKFTLGLALHNLVRAATLAVIGYLVYELVVGYAQGKAASAAAAPAEPAPQAAPSSGRAPTASRPTPIVGGGDHAGRAIQVDDGTGTHHTTRVGRGVIRR